VLKNYWLHEKIEHLFFKPNLGPLMDYNNIHDVNNFVVLTVFDVAMTMIHLSSLTDESCIWLFEKKTEHCKQITWSSLFATVV